MHSSRLRFFTRSGFTLIELLVVISLIALVSAGVGMVLSGSGDRANAMKNAQATLSSILAGARARAALNDSDALIYVNADPASRNFLREIRIAVPDGADFVVKGEAVILPKGVFLVPADGAFTPVQVEFRNDWADLYTSVYDATEVPLKDSPGGNDLVTSGTSSKYNRLSLFKRQGSTTTPGKIVLAPGVLEDGNKIVFDRPDTVRGMLVSRYGVASFVSDPEAFRN